MVRFGVIVLAASAGLVTAGLSPVDDAMGTWFEPAGTTTSTGDIDISGLSHWDLEGSPNNERLRIHVGRYSTVTAIGWDVNLTTFNGSWASEAVIGLRGSEGDFNFTPGLNDAFSVSNMNYRSNGLIDLTLAGLPNLRPDLDGYIELIFFETFDDVEGAVDATWQAGSFITLGGRFIPSPGTLGLLGFGGLVGCRRRR